MQFIKISNWKLKKISEPISLRKFKILLSYFMETYQGETLNSVNIDTKDFCLKQSNNLYIYPTTFGIVFISVFGIQVFSFSHFATH